MYYSLVLYIGILHRFMEGPIDLLGFCRPGRSGCGIQRGANRTQKAFHDSSGTQ